MTEQKNRIGLSAITQIGFKGYLFAVIGGYLQRKLGSMVGVMPGSEMKLAVQLAKKNNARIALIDRNIETTLKRFSESLTWKERFRSSATSSSPSCSGRKPCKSLVWRTLTSAKSRRKSSSGNS